MSDIQALAENDFSQWIRNRGDLQSEEVDEHLVREIFQRLPFLDTDSVKVCWKILARCLEHSQVR